jgi:hypothetical protein
MSEIEKIVEEFAAEFEAGRRPDPGTFLVRVGSEQRAELADRLDHYLDQAPATEWDPGGYARSPVKAAVDRVFESLEGSSGRWPELLPRLRNRARLRRAELVERLASALGFPGSRERIADYYHRMEHGMLPAEGVSDRVLDALAAIVGSSRETLRQAGSSGGISDPELSAAIFARTATPAPELLDEPHGGPAGGPEESVDLAGEAGERPARSDDREIDRLFTGG